MSTNSPDQKQRPPAIEIHIDRQAYELHDEALTGEQLRHLPTPPIGPERDLYEIRPGQDDFLVEANVTVRLRVNMRFFTAPGRINPGQPE